MSDERKFVQELAVQLTPSERADRGRELANMLERIRETDRAEKERRKGFKAELDEMKLSADRLQRAVHTGSEPRPIECERVPNIERSTWDIYRLDTGELASSEAMTQGEKEASKQYEIEGVWGAGREIGKGVRNDAGDAGDVPPKKKAKADATEPGRKNADPTAADTKKKRWSPSKSETAVDDALDGES